MDYEKIVNDFCKLASDFCLWAEGEPNNEKEEHFLATNYVAKLYLGGLELPICEPIKEHDWIVSKEAAEKVFKRFSSLPFQYYWEIYHPVAVEPEEPVTGDLCDDLRDIYIDIKNGLAIWNKGNNVDAVFHWKNTFGFHWATHAVSALKALHSFEINE